MQEVSRIPDRYSDKAGISAVIPYYGDPKDTLELIRQLQEQVVASSLEIIVSDDCSPVPFPQTEGVRLVRRETNGGFGSAVNSGAAVATGRWLFILNSDLTLKPNFLQAMVDSGERLGHALVSPQVVDHKGIGQWVGRAFPTTFHYVWEWFTPLARFRSTNFWHRMVGHDLKCTTGAVVETDWVIGACMMLPTELFLEMGGFDESFFMNCEEVDLQRRLRDRGVPRVFDGTITVEHLGGGSSGDSTRRRRWLLESRFRYAQKWQESNYLVVALKIATYLNFIYNTVRSCRNAKVSPRFTLQEELEYIKKAQAQT
ncbi:glycosyltransferase family 2 protein [Rothia sp. P4278]|uniref:glycosyltransferase family 2 protein n=1 Tax=Rothia sp. P4278 TaxID=3402658 RepID=UPI003AEC2632